MKILKIEEIKAGLTVSKDVLDPKGILLFKAGIVLTDDLINKIKDRMVPFVYVEDGGATGGLTEADIKKMQDETDAAVTKTFSDVMDNPTMASLCEAARAHLKSKIKI